MNPKLPATREFLRSAPFGHFIDGGWTPSVTRQNLPAHDPGEGETIAEIAAGDETDVDRAVSAASRAFGRSAWSRLAPNDRAVILHRLADLVERNAALLAEVESLNVGKIAAAAEADVRELVKTFRYYADLSVAARRREAIAVPGFEVEQMRFPYGVCAFVLPWNFPLLLLGWGIAPALAAGNTVVVKPSEEASLSMLCFCRLAEQAGVPKGVLNLVTGLGETAGAALARHPGIKRMSFTGSPEVGRTIAEACGRNLVPVKLELGGKGAAVVFEDVDVDATAQALAGAITLNTGQVCCTATRWVVQRQVYEPFVRAVVQRLQTVRIGHGSDPQIEMGPLISERQRERVLGYLRKGEADGARVVLRGGPVRVKGHEKGYYISPALLEGSPENVCAKEEVFGPAAFLVPFDSEDEAIDLVNRSAYGLGNSVWSRDASQARRVAENLVAGTSWINCHNQLMLGVPYAGCNLSGMGGGVLGPDAYFDYLRPQSMIRPRS